MNPTVRDISHQNGLWDAIQNGIVDVIGSDHAPHTKEEKSGPIRAVRVECPVYRHLYSFVRSSESRKTDPGASC